MSRQDTETRVRANPSSRAGAIAVLRGAAVAACLVLSAASPAAGQTVASFNQATGLFKVQHRTADLVEAELTFWRGNWEWLGLGVKAETVGDERRVRWLNTNTGLSIEAGVAQPKSNALTWRMKASEDASRGMDTYGAVVFKVSKPALKELGITAVPELLPDNTGWTLALGPDQPPLSVTFDKPLGKLEFERGDTGEIRAYFVIKNDKADTVDVAMTVTSPSAIAPSAAERLATKTQNWRQHSLHWNKSPVDLSFLNAAEKPAGKRGFLRAEGEDFVFADGTKARFWGTNITAFALFQTTPPELVRNQAKRLSQLGFNLVRIHHHDSAWVAPNVFNPKTGDTRELNAYAMSRLDWWIACLKAEGIYIWLDLHVGREVTAKDGIEGFEEMSGGQQRGKVLGFSYINETVQERMKEFATSYLTHVNDHTGLAYKDDPAVMAVLITNENDLSHHFGNALLPDKNVPWHTKRYMALAGEFAARHSLDADKVWRSWEFGPSKLFLADLEHKFNVEMTAHLRQLGVKAPIIGTNFWGQMTVAGLLSLAAADFIDVHSYGRANEVESNPRYKPGMASWIAAGAVTGKPLTVSEWNVEPFPVFDRSQAALHLAAIASLQGWNGLMQYAYSQSPMAGTIGPGNWEAFNDPALIATMPAAALLYRGRHVSEGPVTYSLQLPPETVTGQDISPVTSRAIRTLTETGRFRITLPKFTELAWFQPAPAPAGVKVVDRTDYDSVGPDKTGLCSDTKEICRDWVRGVVTVDTPKTQLASGWLGEQTVELADTTVALTTGNASVAVQSLDDAPIAKSGKILISVSAQAIPVSPGRLPYFTEPVEGRVLIRARPGLKLAYFEPTGIKRPVNTTRQGDRYEIFLNDSFASFWGILE